MKPMQQLAQCSVPLSGCSSSAAIATKSTTVLSASQMLKAVSPSARR